MFSRPLNPPLSSSFMYDIIFIYLHPHSWNGAVYSSAFSIMAFLHAAVWEVDVCIFTGADFRIIIQLVMQDQKRATERMHAT